MARKTVLVSDVSGAEIEDGKGAQVTINVGRDLQSGKTIFTILAVMRGNAPAPTPAPSSRCCQLLRLRGR